MLDPIASSRPLRCPFTRLAAALVLASSAMAQQGPEALRFERLPVEEATGGGIIFSILQDQQGFIWLGTNGGLKRHDGYGFLVFEHDPSDPSSIADNEVRALLEDRSGTLWVGTDEGLQRFDRTTRRFHQLPVGLGEPRSLSDPRVRSIFEDANGNLWVGTENGLNQLDPSGGAVNQFLTDVSNPNRLGRSVIQTITEDSFGVLWFGTRNGLDRLEPAAGAWTRYVHDSEDPESLPWPVVTSVFEDTTGALWIGTHGGGLSKLDRDTNGFVSYAETSSTNRAQNSVMSIVEDGDALWVGTYGGLKRFDLQRERFVTYHARPSDPNGLASNYVETLYRDRGGNLWIGTHNGTHKLPKWRKRFRNFVHDPLVASSLPGGRVTAISGDATGNVWVGSWGGGIAKLDRRTGSFTRYRHDPENPNSLARDWVAALYHNRAGELWIGTNSIGGLSRLDERTGRFTHYRHDDADPSSLSGNRVVSILEDSHGTHWFGTYGDGLNRLDRSDADSGRFQRYTHTPGEPGGLSHDTIQSMYEDESGTLWIGTATGLDRFDRETGRFHPYGPDGLRPSESTFTVFVIHEDEADTLWLGTSRGLLSVDRVRGRVRSTAELSDIVVFGLLEDQQGNLWLHTARGLIAYDPRTKRVRHFSYGDGFKPAGRDVYVSNAYFRGGDGTMFFGGVNGLTEFHPDEIQPNPNPPLLAFTDFQLFHAPVSFGEDAPLEHPIDETAVIELSHRDNVVSFEFAALEYASPENNRYAYQLDGFDSRWVDAGFARRATYTNLGPGNYTFRVKGSNNDGRWNEDGISVELTIAPAFWQTTWFRVLVALFGVGLALALHRARIYRLQRAASILERRVREKTGELSEQNAHLEEEVCQRKAAEAELRSAQAQLVQSEKTAALGQLTAGILHEINTPVGVLKANADLALRCIRRLKDATDEQSDRALGLLEDSSAMNERASKRIEQLLGHLKRFVRLDAAPHAVFDIHDGLDSTLAVLGAERRSGITIERDYGDLPPVSGYPAELNQVFMTVVENALGALDGAGSVTIRTSTDGDEVAVRVIDSGRGMPQEKADRLFDMGFSTTNGRIGAGMGLAQAYDIVARHGGTIAATSSPGSGTEIAIRIPATGHNGELELPA